MAIQDMYTALMSVYSHVDGQSGTGGLKRGTPSLKASDIPCRRESAGATQQITNGVLSRWTNHVVFTDYADVNNGDDLVIEDITIRVTGRPKRSEIGGIETFYRIEGIEIEN